jgi:SAM-dependent methyltransferase
MIDWNHIWKQTLQASRDGRLENLCEKEEIAERYDRSEAIRRDGKMRADALEIDPSWSVLDIGAGPGTLALPLARRAKRVSEVEPSLAMVERLKRHIDEEGISNIRIISAPWEELSDEEVGRHDLVIASYSLVFLDIREALLRWTGWPIERSISIGLLGFPPGRGSDRTFIPGSVGGSTSQVRCATSSTTSSTTRGSIRMCRCWMELRFRRFTRAWKMASLAFANPWV